MLNIYVDFISIARKFIELKTTVGRKGYGLDVAIKSLFLQFYYDLSDRQLEERMRDDLAFRWFCGINLDEETPDHTFYCRVRTILGAKRIGQMFKNIMQKAEEKGIVRQVFTFVDATAVKAKETTWEERDKAIADGEKKLNNKNVEKYSVDKDARFGCKGKNKEKDKWLTKLRAPFEGIFSKDMTRARYRGLKKVQLQAFLEAIVFNVKRLVVINAPPLFIGA